MDGKEKGVKVEQDHISALYHSSHSCGKQAVGSMVLLPDVVAGPGLRGAVGAQAVRIECWGILEGKWPADVACLWLCSVALAWYGLKWTHSSASPSS